MNDPQLPETMRRVLERYAITYEVRPEWSVHHRDRTLRQVGYVVDLYGTDGSRLAPGDERCREIFSGLSEIARRILPPDEGECHIGIDGLHPQLHYGIGKSRHGTVRLEMHVRHRHDLDRPVDAGEVQVLKALLGRLDTLVGRGRRRRHGKTGAQ